jgi:hypothetical protein
MEYKRADIAVEPAQRSSASSFLHEDLLDLLAAPHHRFLRQRWQRQPPSERGMNVVSPWRRHSATTAAAPLGPGDFDLSDGRFCLPVVCKPYRRSQ